MKLTLRMTVIAVSAVVTCITMAAATPANTADFLSPLDLIADSEGKTLYIAEATAKQVAVFDIASGRVIKTISIPAGVSGLALAVDESKLYVTAAAPNGKVFVIDTENCRVTDKIPVGHTPTAPVVSPNGETLYVCNRFSNNISVIDIASHKEIAKIAVPREPIAAAITADGKVLFVANHLPAGASDGDYNAAELSVIDTASHKVATSIQFPNGSTALKDVTISPDGQHAYVTHILARYQLPATQLERGWMNTNALTIIDVPNIKLLNTVLLDDVDLGAANPWGVACTTDGKYICVTTAGTHELSVIDKAKLHDKIDRAASGEKVSDISLSAEDVPNDLSFLVMLRRRLKLTGNGPRGLVLVGTRAYVAEYFTDSLGVVDINPDIRPKAQSIALGPRKSMTIERKGEMFFHDATLCFQKWQSCSSCHPGDARADALNWDLLNDGIGNPKNTRSLLFAHRMPPAMAMGIRSDAETAVRAGIRHILFAVRPEEEALAIDEYLKSLKPVSSPYLVNGELSRRAKRGRKIFQTAGCAACHTPGFYTDLKIYNLDTGTGLDTAKPFDTPTLIELWRTAPYLHDGRAETIVDVLKKHNPNDKHGRTSDLTDKQVRELAEFMLSL